MDLIKKFFQFAIGNGIVLILGIVSSPIITRIISPSNMGKYSMFNTVSNLIMVVFFLGIDQSYVRYYHDENKENRTRLLRKCVKITLIVNILVSIIILILYSPISLYIIGEKSFIVTMLMSIYLISNVISRFSLLEIRMQQKAKLYSFLNILSKLNYLLIIIIMFYFSKKTYMTLILAVVFSSIIVSVLSVALEWKQWFKVGNNICELVSSKEIIKYGIPFIFSSAIMWIFQSIDKITIKQFCGYGEVGLYSGAMSIVALLNNLQVTFTTFWIPIAYERYNKNPNDKEFFLKVNKIVTVFMLIVSIILIASKDLIILMLGEEYRDAMFIFPYLVFMPVMYTISETTVLGINFKKKTVYHIYISLISAIINLVGNFILVPKFGAIGAAISTGISYIVFFFTRTFISNKFFKVNYNLKRFTFVLILTYLFSTYCSFNNFNLNILMFAILNIFIILFMYKEVVKCMLNRVKYILYR
ncbi:oligosaccharide flippase family protein [Clostridium perfringens]|uniref:oligosaccharide flippase family protein n=1 Tax=Clostridium perfringens TaxID=1502 RepID=UPI0018E4279A|nr:oligosaccharide flippase family protein [Clostridium perfringens]MBI6077501.1 oligosaccharide flippase family protein [Clostridium perfringens]